MCGEGLGWRIVMPPTTGGHGLSRTPAPHKETGFVFPGKSKRGSQAPFGRLNEGGSREGEKTKSSPPWCRFLWYLSFGQAKERYTLVAGQDPSTPAGPPLRMKALRAVSGRRGHPAQLRAANSHPYESKVGQGTVLRPTRPVKWDRGRFPVPPDPAQLNPKHGTPRACPRGVLGIKLLIDACFSIIMTSNMGRIGCF